MVTVAVGRGWDRWWMRAEQGGGLGLLEVGIRGGVFGLQPLPPYVGTMSVGLLSGHPYHTLLSPTPHVLTYPTLPALPYPTVRGLGFLGEGRG